VRLLACSQKTIHFVEACGRNKARISPGAAANASLHTTLLEVGGTSAALIEWSLWKSQYWSTESHQLEASVQKFKSKLQAFKQVAV